MRSDLFELRLLLDEHYPPWLAGELTADGIDTVAVFGAGSGLRGLDDRRFLEAAVAEGRVVVTEDVTTFSAAITDVPDHLGVIYCHHARRTEFGTALFGEVVEVPTEPGAVQPQHAEDHGLLATYSDASSCEREEDRERDLAGGYPAA
ncbi:MAG TPA: DUF5615 family PIN-like protein [Pseudonocardiaceae bacterium]|nr:DUF5615 family PIN-like protein [Pseudonocardiaceae bacterium]